MPVRSLPRKLLRRTIAVVALALALGATGSPAAPVASADAASWLSRQSYFHFPPFRPKRMECAERRMLLKRGWYEWGARLSWI